MDIRIGVCEGKLRHFCLPSLNTINNLAQLTQGLEGEPDNGEVQDKADDHPDRGKNDKVPDCCGDIGQYTGQECANDRANDDNDYASDGDPIENGSSFQTGQQGKNTETK